MLIWAPRLELRKEKKNLSPKNGCQIASFNWKSVSSGLASPLISPRWQRGHIYSGPGVLRVAAGSASSVKVTFFFLSFFWIANIPCASAKVATDLSRNKFETHQESPDLSNAIPLQFFFFFNQALVFYRKRKFKPTQQQQQQTSRHKLKFEMQFDNCWKLWPQAWK